ncbi:MAG: hypothetical protein JST26_06020 [Bacteroidetes bacterium]|nr:hypothetical protein [Bacteroidota bacterium]
MSLRKFYHAGLLCLFVIGGHRGYAQSDSDSPDSTAVSTDDGKGLHLGIYVGTYMANKYSASMYDGYGLDINGLRNTFGNSFMYNQIVNYYGGGLGGVDQIALALNVNHNEWSFTESDMPINMHYNITYLVGLNMRYNLSKQEALVVNINGTKLTVNGNFSISTVTTNNGIQGVPQVHQFVVTGGEQRLMFQLGYQRILGTNDKLNFFAEGGLNITMVKYLKNQAFITSTTNPVQIDLMSPYNQDTYNYVRSKYFVGVGPGIFAGLGLNLTLSPKYTVQALYMPSYDRIKMGLYPSFKLQHSFGLRFYYNL